MTTKMLIGEVIKHTLQSKPLPLKSRWQCISSRCEQKLLVDQLRTDLLPIAKKQIQKTGNPLHEAQTYKQVPEILHLPELTMHYSWNSTTIRINIKAVTTTLCLFVKSRSRMHICRTHISLFENDYQSYRSSKLFHIIAKSIIIIEQVQK